ncbi:MAG: hypothetical protein OXC46_03160 [Thaumarchaeota archaeon]|nr:hypothetical protein [Nitrososphaerota archaeon]
MTSDSEIKRLKENLLNKTKGRECHTMADLIDGKIEHSALEAWKLSPFLHLAKKKHTALADPIAALTDLSSFVIDAVRPSATGRMLVHMHETTNDVLKIRMRNKGKAVKTARGNGSIYSYAGRSQFIEIRPDKEIGVEDGWSLNDMEDAEWNVQADAIADLRMEQMERETEIIVEKLKSVSDEQLKEGANRLVGEIPGTGATADNLIDVWTALNEADQEPDLCIIGKKVLGQLLKDDDFKDSTLLGSFMDYSRGMVGNFLGMQMMVSTLHPDNAIYAINKQRAIQYVLRRDSLMVPYEKPPHDWLLNISTRYGIEFGDTGAIAALR